MKNESNIFRLKCEQRNHIFRETKEVQLIEYDDRIRQEEERYSRLLSELSETHWFTRHVAARSGFNQSYPHKINEFNSHTKHAVGRTKNEGLSSDIEATKLTSDEILFGGDLTLDQIILENKKPSVSHVDKKINRTSAQHPIAFQYTPSPQERYEDRYEDKEKIQSTYYELPESNGKESLSWETITVKSTGLVLHCWRGISS